MGPDGLLDATEHAILAANYVATRLKEHFPVLYTGADGLVAHECILDIRPLTKATGVTNDDIAKRLIDYGFHAPTMSFPVAGTLMVEPTESEDMAELDRFVEAMVAIRGGDREGRHGRVRPHRQPAAERAAHAGDAGGEGTGPTRATTADLPGPRAAGPSYLSPVRRIDQAYGDRNLVCACPPPEAFAEHDFSEHAPAGTTAPAGPPAGAPTTGDDGRRRGRPAETGLPKAADWQGDGMTDTAAKADLQRYLQEGRDALLWKLDGLSDYDVRRPMVPTGTNLLGLVKHVASVELGYFGETFGRPWRSRCRGSTTDAEPNWDMWATADESRQQIVAFYRRAWAHADATIDGASAGRLGQVPWWRRRRVEVTLHRVLVHVIAETHRHAGHADIVRELVDGAAGLRRAGGTTCPRRPAWWEGYRAELERVAAGGRWSPTEFRPGPATRGGPERRCRRAAARRRRRTARRRCTADATPARGGC